MQREFLDWNRPALLQVADLLVSRYQARGAVDLSDLIVVFPGRQAGRRFLELLLDRTGGSLFPPQIITVGQLPELLYVPQKPFASSFTQKLAWAEALQGLERTRLELVLPQPPEDHDVDAWLRLGELLSRQHRELAADQLNFADVAEKGVSLEGFNEQPRWEVLADVQQRYLNRLDELELWDQQTARLFAIKYKECQTTKTIALVGTVDLNRTTQEMLNQVRENLHIFIHAPESLSSHFETFGNLNSVLWEEQQIPIDESQIHVVEDPFAQAQCVAMEVAKRCDKYAASEISLGVPDDRIVPHLHRILAAHGAETHWLIEKKLPDTGPYKLLESIAEFLGGERTDQFAELIRHPDLIEWIDRHKVDEDWLTCWDLNVAAHLQRRVRKVLGRDRSAKVTRLLVDKIRELLKPFSGSARPLSEWAEPLRQLLISVYGHLELDLENQQDRELQQTVEVIFDACVNLSEVPEQLAPVVRGRQAILLTLEEITGEFLAAPATGNELRMSGWLDLPLDDSPVAIITSINEGFVPSAVNHDLFLPNRLRFHLGIEDNLRRYARDAYALSAILHSHESVCLIAAKRDVRKEPLTPSRLLFACPPEEIAHRVHRFFGEPEKLPSLNLFPASSAEKQNQFTIPRPRPLSKERRSFRVTEFKDYITSPYRYYLRHVLQLGELDDNVVELNPAGFGSLIHEVLQAFGLSEQRHQTESAVIAKFLNSELDRLVQLRYGSDPLFPILIQVEQIRHRLEIFSQWQANWASTGWQIRFTEIGSRKNVTFPLDDGTEITIRGRVDRVDYHPKLNQWIVFDYKTSDRGASPDSTHRKNDEWIDLQLPLYRHLVEPFGVTGDVRLGYITLPRTTTQIGEQIADWSEDQLRQADQVTKEVAQKIINEEFWVELDRPVTWFQEYAGICQDNVFDREAIV